MAGEVSLASVNPLANIGGGGGAGNIGMYLLVFFIAVVIIGMIGLLIYFKSVKKQYWIKIHVYRLIGNVPTRVAIYSAKEVPFGMAGDRLWRVASSGVWKIKAIKWLPCGKIQTAPSEFWYYIRKDGEWINFQMQDLNEVSQNMGVKFVQEDMRLQRLATERLLEQRLMNKSFWDKWGNTIMMVIIFLVIAICMVLIFFQFGKVLDKMIPLVQMLTESLARVEATCQPLNNTIGGTGLIPA